jgi:CRP/FNR family cyclic AMP-dependent transcriptional regulator
VTTPIEDIVQDPEFPEGTAWRRRSFQANDNILQEGSEGRSLFLIESGSVRVTARVVLEEDRRVQPGICDLQAGELFGELGLFENQPRSASVMAVTDTQLIEIDGEQLSRYLDAHPEIGYRVLKSLFAIVIARLSSANRRIEYLMGWGLKAHGIEKHL